MFKSASSAAFGLSKMASSDAEDKLGLSDEEEVRFEKLCENFWKQYFLIITLLQMNTELIILTFFQLEDSKLNSEEEQNDDSDYNTSKKRKRGKQIK